MYRYNTIQATVSEGLAQGPNVAAGVGFDPAALRTEGTEPTTEPPHLFIWTGLVSGLRFESVALKHGGCSADYICLHIGIKIEGGWGPQPQILGWGHGYP